MDFDINFFLSDKVEELSGILLELFSCLNIVDQSRAKKLYVLAGQGHDLHWGDCAALKRMH